MFVNGDELGCENCQIWHKIEFKRKKIWHVYNYFFFFYIYHYSSFNFLQNFLLRLYSMDQSDKSLLKRFNFPLLIQLFWPESFCLSPVSSLGCLWLWLLQPRKNTIIPSSYISNFQATTSRFVKVLNIKDNNMSFIKLNSSLSLCSASLS